MAPYIRLDRYVVDILARDLVGHDRSAAAFLVYLHLWGKRGTGPIPMSYSQIADGTGLSKRAVQTAVARLGRRKLLSIRRATPTATPEYEVLTPWRRA